MKGKMRQRYKISYSGDEFMMTMELHVRKTKDTPAATFVFMVLYNEPMSCTVAGLWPKPDESFRLKPGEDVCKYALIYGKLGRLEIRHDYNIFPYISIGFNEKGTSYRLVVNLDDSTFEFTNESQQNDLWERILAHAMCPWNNYRKKDDSRGSVET